MAKLNFKGIIGAIQSATIKHSPEILTGMGIAGMITTTILAVKATPKAMKLIEEEKIFKEKEAHEGGTFSEKDKECDFKLTPLEVIKVAWKPYIPAIVTGGLSVTSLICASSTNARRNAALATAYSLSETALKEYREKVVETIGEKKEQAVLDKIAKDKIDRNPVVNNEVIITERGNTLCYDTISGRYFKSDPDMLKRVENELNRRMIDEMYVSLNEFYYEIGLNGTTMGHDLGWNMDKGYIELRFSSQLASDEQPCLVVDFNNAPQYNFRKFY